MPYITASIILQLMTVVSPTLEQLAREGEVGQQKITQYTRYLTVALALAQAIGYVALFKGQDPSVITNDEVRQPAADRHLPDRRNRPPDVDR